MINIKTISITILIVMSLTTLSDCLLARTIAMNYLYLDKNGDNLVSVSQLEMNTKNKQKKQMKQEYYNWKKYLLSIYPTRLFYKFDENQNEKIQLEQLDKTIKQKIKKYAGTWTFNKYNLLKDLSTQDYLSICDMDRDKLLNQVEFVNCLKGFLLFQYQFYPFKIKSSLYPNRTIGYSYQQFKKLLPEFPQQQLSAQHQIKSLFDSFQWPESKLPQDHDLLIGHEQGKFMEPTILYFYLDKNWDEKLDKQQTLGFFKKYGGQQAFNIADLTGDGQLDQAQIISYYMQAVCIQDCSFGHRNNCNGQENNSGLKYQTSKQICYMFEKLLAQLQKREQKIIQQTKDVKSEEEDKKKEEL